MTRQAISTKESTQFSQWLRLQPEIDSKNGSIVTNLDYIWENYNSGKFMLIEEKRSLGKMPWSQKNQFRRIDKSLRQSDIGNYRGFHVITFEHTSPIDGRMFWDGIEISRDDLINILQFNAIGSIYTSFFNKNINNVVL